MFLARGFTFRVRPGCLAAVDTDVLDEWLDGRVAAREFSGAALVWRGGKSLFSYAGGIAHRGHGVPVTGSTRFTVASVTKMVTATAALRLVERGEVRLDQPLTEVLPAEQQTAALTGAHTLHHLLSHTSGLPNYHDDEAVTWDSFLSCWDRVPCQRARRPADLLPLFRDLPAVAPPGARFSYADANYILAGLVIEAVTGKPYAEAAAEEVLTPAGMEDSGFDQRDADPPRLATGYLHEPDVPFASWRANVFSGPAGGMPDGGLVTTTADLARLVDALLAGRLVSPATLRHDLGAVRHREREPVRLRSRVGIRRWPAGRARAQRARPRRLRGRRTPPSRGHDDHRARQPGPWLVAGLPPPRRRSRAE